MASDWERTPVNQSIYRHRNRGGLWLVDGKPLFLPGASLNDVVGLVESIDAVNHPPPAPTKPPAPPPRHDYPRFIEPHPSHVTQPASSRAPNIWVDGFKFNVDRDSNVVTVLVRNEVEEARALAPKKKY